MSLPTNDDFSNRELSIEELEAIAGASWLGDAWNAITHPSVLIHDVLWAVGWVEAHWPKGSPGPWTTTIGLKAK